MSNARKKKIIQPKQDPPTPMDGAIHCIAMGHDLISTGSFPGARAHEVIQFKSFLESLYKQSETDRNAHLEKLKAAQPEETQTEAPSAEH